ncbi:gamma carbonic anhydrase family protein [Photobacterium sanguinicancri]|uniref:Gamma carbonic anhydrase family protein n=1 Tax=Photobacterium sanguinicancri TaxID=875932 RepID=A0ABX4FS05_9GAMM|nr:gamma carbonic anhydrase family protein [Photobacterium sanguinicancri]OZS41698.1 gamma carbonic anhydrase family protein [Photobacterium sanguinicancri]
MPDSMRTFKGKAPKLGLNTYIDASAVMTGEISLGDESSIWPLVAARGDVNHISIGHRSNIQDGSVLHVSRATHDNPSGHPLIIGDDVTVGHKAMLHGCHIGDRVLVGMGAIILDGAVIHNDIIIGAGSLVPPGKILESGFLYIGSPIKQARSLTDKERAFLSISADNYVRLKDDYLAEISQ